MAHDFTYQDQLDYWNIFVRLQKEENERRRINKPLIMKYLLKIIGKYPLRIETVIKRGKQGSRYTSSEVRSAILTLLDNHSLCLTTDMRVIKP